MTFPPSRGHEAALRDARLMDGLRVEAERRGWTFHAEPSKDIIPAFLDDYQPDAIILTPEGGTVIEIADRQDLAQKGLLAGIARRVSAQRGWSFRAFYANPSDQADDPVRSATPEDVVSGIEEARSLLDAGHERAALVMGWATLEAMARLVMARLVMGDARMDPTGSLSAMQVVQILVQEGYVSDEDALRLRAMLRLRNDVVHGGLRTTIPREEVARLIEDLEAISSDLKQPA